MKVHIVLPDSAGDKTRCGLRLDAFAHLLVLEPAQHHYFPVES